MKLGFVLSEQGIINIYFIRDARPRIQWLLDLGIPNFSVFMLELPIPLDNPAHTEIVFHEGTALLLEQVKAFLEQQEFDSDGGVINSIMSAIKHADLNMNLPAPSTGYEIMFPLGLEFYHKVMDRMVKQKVASKESDRAAAVWKAPMVNTRYSPPEGRVVKQKDNTALQDARRLIDQYKGSLYKHSPGPLYVILYDQNGRQTGVSRVTNQGLTKWAGSSKGVLLYHGTQADIDRPCPSGTPNHILWASESKPVANNYAHTHWRKGAPNVWEITLKPDVDIVDLRDLGNPITRSIKDKISKERQVTLGYPISDETWASYADFGLFEAYPWILNYLKRHWVLAVSVTDTMSMGGGNPTTSVAILADSAIAETHRIQFEKQSVSQTVFANESAEVPQDVLDTLPQTKVPPVEGTDSWWPGDAIRYDTKKRVELLEEKLGRSLKRIGEGSSRAVYELTPDVCIKLALNSAGIAQNKQEFQIFSQLQRCTMITRIFYYDTDFEWLICEKACRAVKYSDPVFQAYGAKTLQEFVWLAGKKAVDSDNPYVKELAYLIHKLGLCSTDLEYTSQWGIVDREGQQYPVLLDYGLTDDVYTRHYAHSPLLIPVK